MRYYNVKVSHTFCITKFTLKINRLKIFTTRAELAEELNGLRAKNKQIGLVPTMGALHSGHISLIRTARQQVDIVVTSIFVNPTQFTDPKDLEKYPRTVEADIKKLEAADCDILFLPEVSEMYQPNEKWHIDLGYLEQILEGEFRPGHYQGVTQIVYKLFNAVEPSKAFFGQKDYQQVMVIRKMIEMLKLPVELVMCPIQRNEKGLALSSRNVHLSADETEQAYTLSKALFALKDSHADPTELKAIAMNIIRSEPGVKLDYFEILDKDTLLPAEQESHGKVALIAATVGKTRLIDNMILN